MTSERVGGKVRKLDVEVSRVKEAAERVQEVLELKVSQSSACQVIHPSDHSIRVSRVHCSRSEKLSPRGTGSWLPVAVKGPWTLKAMSWNPLSAPVS